MESDKKLREMLKNRTMDVSVDGDEDIEYKPNVSDLEQKGDIVNLNIRTDDNESSASYVEFYDIKTETTMDDIVDDTKQFNPKVPNDPIAVKWRCAKCSLEFETQGLLTTHHKIHLLKKKTGTVVHKHQQDQYLEDIHNWNYQEYICDICDKKFPSKKKVKLHLVIHNSESRRKFLCVACGQQFFSQFGLNQHIRVIHDKEMRFQCSQCNRQFAHKQHLKTHMNRHEGIRPYPCKICTKAFYDSSTLRVHTQSVHSELNSFICSICCKAFNRKGNLRMHMIKTHNYLHLQLPKSQITIKHVNKNSSK